MNTVLIFLCIFLIKYNEYKCNNKFKFVYSTFKKRFIDKLESEVYD